MYLILQNSAFYTNTEGAFIVTATENSDGKVEQKVVGLLSSSQTSLVNGSSRQEKQY